jgi:Sec-independent protein secretion pathway component TatC
MSVWQNLSELGARIIAILLTFILIFLISLEYIEEILVVVSRYFSQNNTNDSFILFSYNSIGNGTNAVYTIAKLSSITLTYPYILVHFYTFIKKGLYTYEKNKILKNIKIFFLYHFIFIIFFFFFLLPFTLSNLNELNEEFSFNTIDISFEIDLSIYIAVIKDIFIFNYVIGLIILLYYHLFSYITLSIISRKIKYSFILLINFLTLYIIKRLDLILVTNEIILNYFILHELAQLYQNINCIKIIETKYGRSRIRTHDCF